MRILLILALVVAGVATLTVTAYSQQAPASAGNFDFGTRTATPTRTTPPSTPTATAGPSLPSLPPGPPPAAHAQALDAYSAECVGNTTNSVRVVFFWAPPASGVQFLDLSIFNDGFLPGRYVFAGGFNTNVGALAWDGLLQGTTHYARVNTLTPSGWQASETIAFYTPICDPTRAEPAPAGDMLALRDRLAGAVQRWPFSTAIAITDLRTGETIDVNGYMPRLPGCTINLFALMRVAVDLQAGRYAEPQPGDLIGQTINRSDPVTARTLMKFWIGAGDLGLGLVRVNDFMHDLGMRSTVMDHPPAFTNESLFQYSDNVITARDANVGLRALWDGRALDANWRDYMLRKMTLVKPGLNYLIPSGIGGGATASHKNGFLYAEGWADNDIGIVWFQRGGQRYGYAISFFTQGVRGKYDDIPLGQQVSTLAWSWFVSRYGYP